MACRLRHHVSAAVAFALFAACTRSPSPEAGFTIEPPIGKAPIDQPTTLFTVHLNDRRDLVSRLPKQVTTVQDPEYKQTQTYESVSLLAFVDAVKPADITLSDDVRLVLLASDGYRSATTIGMVRTFGGRLAVRDVNAAAGHAWKPIPGKPSMTPAPYYLVWPSTNADLPWPYAVTTITASKTDPADLSVPDDDPAAKAGHALFKKHCSSCHSVNGSGGAVGPELNVPANVTEYWNRAALKQFIRSPAAIRSNAKMPTLTDLTDADVDAIVAYLVRMKKLKLAR